MAAPDPTNTYLRSKVFSASPEELRLMLLDGALKFARQGREGMATKNHELTYNGLSSCKNIILELINALRPEVDPALCSKLSGLYMFMYRRLIDANLEKRTDMIDEVIKLLEYERETWLLVMQKLAAERAQGGAPRAAAPGPLPAAPAPAAPAEQRMSLSIEG